MSRKIVMLGDGRLVRMGRLRPPVPARSPLRLCSYVLGAERPTPPAAVDYMTKAGPALAETYLNNELGDCVEAWVGHAIGIFTANRDGAPVLFSPTEIEAAYSAWSGYVPGNPATDVGTDEHTALNLWQSNGFQAGAADPHKISGWITVDAANPVETRLAVWLFENLMLGMELPAPWIDSNPAPGFTWDIAGPPDPSNGHCPGSGAYEPGRFKLSTWGMEGWITDAALAAYAVPSAQGEAYAVLSPEIIIRASEKAPNGIDWQALQADLDSFFS